MWCEFRRADRWAIEPEIGESTCKSHWRHAYNARISLMSSAKFTSFAEKRCMPLRACNLGATSSFEREAFTKNPYNFGGEGEIDSGHLGPRSSGALRASKIARGDFVELQQVRPRTLPPAEKIAAPKTGGNFSGGEGEIRTHEPRKGPPVFKTGAFKRSATSPFWA